MLLLLLTFGCESEPLTGPLVDPAAPEVEKLVAVRVADLGKPDPVSAHWAEAPVGYVQLIAQPMVTPRPELVTTERLQVQSLHDGNSIAFRLAWADTEASEAGHLGEYSDGVAIEFPLLGGDPPPVFMGGLGAPVHIFHWRYQYQRDAEVGKPDITRLYPNASVDMYAMDFHVGPESTVDEREMFNPAVALGNPQARRKTGVDEIIAEGFSTSAVQAGHHSEGVGVWREGNWAVVIQRPMEIDGAVPLRPGTPSNTAFAVWQGGKGEVGSRKSVRMVWVPLEVSP